MYDIRQTEDEEENRKLMPRVPHNASKVTISIRYHNNAGVSYFEMNCAALWHADLQVSDITHY